MRKPNQFSRRSFVKTSLVASAEPDAATKEKARALGNKGLSFYDNGEFKPAMEHLEQAFRLYPAPTLGLYSARALAKMEAIIEAQGRRPFDPDRPGLASKTFEVTADRDGVVTAIDNLRLSRLARLSGAPKMRGAGVDLFRKMGDAVSRGDPLYRVYAEYGSDLAFAREWAAHESGYAIGEPGEPLVRALTRAVETKLAMNRLPLTRTERSSCCSKRTRTSATSSCARTSAGPSRRRTCTTASAST